MDIDSELLRGALDLQESNDPPKKSQVQALETFRTHCRERLVSVDAQILELESKLANLVQIRSNWVSKVEVCTRILSPIRRLPAEIIQEIFRFCLPKRRERTSSRLQAPIVLCQICSTWRRIALGFSALWEELAVCVNHETASNKKPILKHITAISEWFSRASPETLLDYSCDIQLSEDTCDEASQIISEVLLPYIHRCRALDMSTWSVADIQSFLCLSSDHIPHLEKAVLRFDLGEADTTPTVFSFAPSLTRVSLRYMSFLDVTPAIDYMVVFPWKQLTHINIAAISPSIWATLFRQCRALQCGTFVLQESLSNHITPEIHFKTTHTILPFLVSLTLVCRGPVEPSRRPSPSELPGWLLDGLDFPLLAKLNFGMEDNGKGFDTRPLSHLPSLKSLSATKHSLSTDNLISLLRASPNVIELELKNYGQPQLFRALAYAPGSEVLLPMLKTIIVHINTKTSLHYQLFMDTIKSRLSIENDSLPSLSNLREVSFLVAGVWSSIFRSAQLELQDHRPDLVVNLMVMPHTHWENKRLEEYMED